MQTKKSHSKKRNEEIIERHMESLCNTTRKYHKTSPQNSYLKKLNCYIKENVKLDVVSERRLAPVRTVVPRITVILLLLQTQKNETEDLPTATNDCFEDFMLTELN
jgi:hypothetical protein